MKMTIEQAQDALVPELRDNIIVTDGGLVMVSHPLVHTLFLPITDMVDHINAMFIQKTEQTLRAREAGNFREFVFAHERPYRADAMYAVWNLDDSFEVFSTYDRNQLLRDVWIDTEFPYLSAEQWHAMFAGSNPDLLMTDKEMGQLDRLNDPVMVYRGYSGDDSEYPLSWSLDPSVARWFAARFATEDKPAMVRSQLVAKRNVYALFNGRGKHEIIVLA